MAGRAGSSTLNAQAKEFVMVRAGTGGVGAERVETSVGGCAKALCRAAQGRRPPSHAHAFVACLP